MENLLTYPKPLPEKGFYYHYKHFLPENINKVNSYAYYILGVGVCTETNQFKLHYQPLYPEARVYKSGRLNDDRPLDMYYDIIPPEKSGLAKEMPRFTNITDQNIIAQLMEIKNKMYS